MMADELRLEHVRALLPSRPVSGHKGTFGHLFVLAGSRGFTGAARLACEAAGRSGAGLVTLGIPQPLGDVAAIMLVEAMTLRLPSTDAETFARDAVEPALEFAAGKQAVVIGPGLSRHPDTIAFAGEFIRLCPAPLLVDADGLNALRDFPQALRERNAPAILTPHPGEMSRLIGVPVSEAEPDRIKCAKTFAEKHGIWVVLKGHRTIIAAPDGCCAVNPTGNHGMGTGGAGDVLSGLIGGLLAQGMAPFDAASLGVYLHGLAGDIAADTMTARAMIARDLIAALPEAWRKVEGLPPGLAGWDFQ